MLKFGRGLILVILLGLAFPNISTSKERGMIQQVSPSNEQFLPVEQIRPGMRGKGRTVFSGSEISEFEVEVLGVLKNARAKGDLILVRVSGGPLEKTGVIAGMSGSPIYINGKLIGALAFAWTFSKEPIAGVTPISEMLKVFSSQPKESNLSLNSSPQEEVMVTALKDYPPLTLRPIQTPLMLAGFDERMISKMEEKLGRFGLVPVQSGGSTIDEDKDVQLAPGSAIGVQLIKGDLDASAIGTLTYLKGNKVLAFGHPMFLAGTTSLPLTSAYIHTILSSQEISFKLGSATKVVGRINEDRRGGITGEVGSFAQLIPLQVTINSAKQGRLEYNFEVINNKFLSPSLMEWAVESSILATEGFWGDSTLRLKFEISLKDYPPISLEDTSSGPLSLFSSLQKLSGTIDTLLNNEFKEVKIKKVFLQVSSEEKRQTATIEGLRLNKTKVKPGDLVKVMVIIKPFESEYVIKSVELKVPENTPEGKIIIKVSDALSDEEAEKSRAPFKFKAKNLKQLIKLLEREVPNTQIIVKMVLPRAGAAISGEELPLLPSSVLDIMRSSGEAGQGKVTDETNLVETRIKTPWVISKKTLILPLMVEGGIGNR